MADSAQTSKVVRPGYGFLISGVAATALALVFAIFLGVTHSRLGEYVLRTLVGVNIILFFLPFSIAISAYFYALRTGFAVISVTHGLFPFMRRNWRWGSGASLWISAVLACLRGV